MTPAELAAFKASVKRRVDGLAQHHGDPEGAHSDEDALRHDVLLFIYEHATNPWSDLACEALKTSGIDFPRWCA